MTSLSDGEQVTPLPFRVSPHMLEDLGLNLYSNLPRVLVEFIANGYDADASKVTVSIDFDKIKEEREVMRAEWKRELAAVGGNLEGLVSLDERLLRNSRAISIEDNGRGMTKDELRDKFLVAGRRRRIEEDTAITPGGRALMGRKGVGKLAGFGVARRVEVLTKVEREDHAHGIRLDFDDIMNFEDTSKVTVPTFKIRGDAGLGKQGTRVTLSRLVHESVKSIEETVRTRIGDHFARIDVADFAVFLNETAAEPTSRRLVYAWPRPDELSVEELVEHEIPAADAGRPVKFDYRLRFVADRSSLKASQRGVRVYAHRRLAAAPSLLHADTNMHGFRMTDYLDGVVHADFIDNLERDYIATDRQGLRWETPLLQPVHEFLGDEIKEACKAYQGFRDKEKEKEVKEDPFTKALIDNAELSSKEKRLAVAICAKLASFHREGVDTPQYQEHARLLVQAIGKGEIFSAIKKIAEQHHPNLQDLAGEVTRLTHAEIDQTLAGMKTRLLAIDALSKIVKDTAFKKANNEDALHAMLKDNPWLIDPTFFEFLVSNQYVDTLFTRLERKLKIGSGVSEGYDRHASSESEPMKKNLRPDLVFLLGNASLGRVVIVELKAPNTPLLHEHLLQLKDYMRKAEGFLRNERQISSVSVEGRLIGTLDLDSRSNQVERLQEALEERGAGEKWEVLDLAELLIRTRNAHQEFLELHEAPTDAEDDG